MNKPIIADISLLLVTFIWGTTFVLVQNAIDSLPPLAFNGIRFLIAALILIFWLLIFEKKQLHKLNKKIILAGVFLGFWLFLGYATQTIGLLYTTSSKAGFITGLNVILVPLFSLVLFKQTFSRNVVFGVITAAVGLFLLTATDISHFNIGDVYVFICAICFALQIIFTGKFSGKYSAILLTVIQITTVSLLALLSSFIFENTGALFDFDILFSREVLIALIITSVFATALAFLAQTHFQKYTTTTRVALIFSMEPVFAAITGFVWAHDRLPLSAIIGCFLIFAGMILAEIPVNKNFLDKKAVNQLKKTP